MLGKRCCMSVIENREKPLISIVIPVYNTEKYLLRLIDSLIKQTYKNFELIFIDDGSTDSSFLKLQKLSEIDERVSVLHQNNSGLSATRNRGIDVSKGKYICFFDSDDYINENTLENLVEAFDLDVDMVYTNAVWEDEVGKIIRHTDYKKLEANYREELLVAYMNEKLGIQVWNKMFKADIIKENKIYFSDCSIGEDVLFIMEYLSVIQGKVKCVDGEYYHYVSRHNSITKTVGSKNHLIQNCVLAEKYKTFVNRGITTPEIIRVLPLIIYKFVEPQFLDLVNRVGYSEARKKFLEIDKSLNIQEYLQKYVKLYKAYFEFEDRKKVLEGRNICAYIINGNRLFLTIRNRILYKRWI